MPYLLAVLIFAAVVAICATPPAMRLSRAVALMTARVGRHGFMSICLVFLIALISMALPSILGSMPVPSVHDEFAYLLAADTFVHGRLANPTHQLWPHFETFHVIHQPTYSSKFPPGQGLALAAGRLLGHPIIGAWLSVSLACAATAWMLRVWAPPRWALLGGIIAALHVVVHWWSQSYWGGGVAFFGGALLGGAAARLMRCPSAAASAIAALGMGILANSRPFEGLLTTVLIMPMVMVVITRRFGARALFVRMLVPMGVVLLPLTAAMAYYNWRITQHVLTMPYVVHQRQYMVAPLMHWQRQNPMPQYRHDVLRRFHDRDELGVYLQQRTPHGFLENAWKNIQSLARWYLRPVPLAIPLVAAVFTLRRRLNRLALLVCVGLPVAHMLLSPWWRMQYMAPALPFLIALIAVGLRRLERLRWNHLQVGTAVVTAVLLTHVYTSVSYAVSYNRRPPPPPGRERADLAAWIMQQPGEHLLIVRYGPLHDALYEWVYNEADIDAAKVVFAREITEDQNRDLLDYFKHRRAWLLEVDIPDTSDPQNTRSLTRLTPLR